MTLPDADDVTGHQIETGLVSLAYGIDRPDETDLLLGQSTLHQPHLLLSASSGTNYAVRPRAKSGTMDCLAIDCSSCVTTNARSCAVVIDPPAAPGPLITLNDLDARTDQETPSRHTDSESHFATSPDVFVSIGTKNGLEDTKQLLSSLPTFLTDQERWAAVQARDPLAAESFLYLVKSTKIYCRPTCPSRRPLLSNVSFASTAEEAEQKGYRPCRRCKPHCALTASAERRLGAVNAVQEIIMRRAGLEEHQPGLEEMAALVGMSKFYLLRVFKEEVGVSPAEYARALRRGGSGFAVLLVCVLL
jgi:methylphosphotriester-DNA--protein-cysteine methyltransferase